MCIIYIYGHSVYIIIYGRGVFLAFGLFFTEAAKAFAKITIMLIIAITISYHPIIWNCVKRLLQAGWLTYKQLMLKV